MFKVKNLFAAIFLAACIFWGMWAYHPAITLGPQPVLGRADVDEIAIIHGAQAVNSWPETMKWWTGPWIAYPQTKFFRPLSSTLYWLEYRAFGPQGFTGFMLVHWISHVLVCALALVLFRRLVPPNVAVLTVGLWASYAARALSLPSPAMALYSWVDSVEAWFSAAALAYLLAGHFYLRSKNWRWFAASLPCFVLAVAAKEMAYMLPLLFVLLAWHERQLGLWKQWWPLVLLVVCGLVWRSYALGGTGQTFGSNGSWLIRWVQFSLGGRLAILVMQGNLFGPGAASFLAAALLALAGKRRPAAILAGSGACFIVATDIFWSGTFGEAWLAFLAPSPALQLDTAIAFALGSACAYFIIRRSREQFLGYGWALMAYLPLLLTVTTAHTSYFPSLGWALWLAVPLGALLEWLCLQARRKSAALWSRVESRQP